MKSITLFAFFVAVTYAGPASKNVQHDLLFNPRIANGPAGGKLPPPNTSSVTGDKPKPTPNANELKSDEKPNGGAKPSTTGSPPPAGDTATPPPDSPSKGPDRGDRKASSTTTVPTDAPVIIPDYKGPNGGSQDMRMPPIRNTITITGPGDTPSRPWWHFW